MIEIKNLKKVYKSNKLVSINNTTLSLPSTGLVTLLGPSGSGKTTLLNVLGGLDDFDSGNITYDDFSVDKYNMKNIDKFRKQNISYIFQNYYLISDLTVYENLRLYLEISNIYDKDEQEKRIVEALNAVGMYKYRKKKVNALSGGQQQRISIARALTKKNKMIIADEPTGNLDSKNSIMVMNILKKISSSSLVLLVTHNESIASFYSDKIIKIKDGTILEEYKPKETNLDLKDNNIYLKDLDKQEFFNDDNIINLYNFDNNKFDLDIILINDTYYIKSSNQIKLINDSAFNVYDKHKKDVAKEEILETNFDNSNFLNVEKKNGFKKFKNKFKESFLNFKNAKTKTLILRLGLFCIGAAFAYLLSSLINSFYINESSIMYATNTYILDSNYDYNNSYNNMISNSKYLSDEKFNQKEDLIDLYDEGKISKFNLQCKAIGSIYDSEQVDFATSFYIYEQIEIGSQKYLYGSLDTTLNEYNGKNIESIIITKGLAKQLIEDSNSKINLNQLIDKTINVSRYVEEAKSETAYSNYKIADVYRIKGIIDSNSICGYIPSYYTNNTAETKIKLEYIKTNVFYADNFNFSIKYFSSYDTAINLADMYSEYSFTLNDSSSVPSNNKEVLINSEYLTTDPDDTLYHDSQLLQSYLKAMGYTIVGSFNDTAKIALCFCDGCDRLFDLLPLFLGNYEFIIYDKSINYDNILNYYDLNKQIIVHNTRVENQNKIYVVSILIVALIFYIYFTQRSRMFTDIKKIGMLRAIGSTKSDIALTYSINAFIESIFTLVIGFGLCSIVYGIISNISNDANNVVSTLFYQVPYYYLALILIVAIETFFGSLPVIFLMRKTPSEIIAKYDI